MRAQDANRSPESEKREPAPAQGAGKAAAKDVEPDLAACGQGSGGRTEMNAYHRQQAARDLDERKAHVKAKARFEDVVAALDLDTDGMRERSADCPACGAVSSLHQCHGGCGFYCEACGETGDMIGLVMLARDAGFAKAVEFLETCLPGKRDGKTMELFR